ncbi:MAG: Ribosomal RNA small subunit methyltransferase H [Gammaproteobacteria bacterium]|nr:Ribosomal RNA small subunit methyltransferase H [Gammaproteobacteria bacterium]
MLLNLCHYNVRVEPITKLNENEHTPVLLHEVLRGLNLRPNGFYIDCTFGRGGHSRAVLPSLDSQGRLLVFDKDVAAIEYAKSLFTNDARVIFIHASFTSLITVVKNLHMLGKVDGILLDLGVSSPQLDNPDYGFSFVRDGKLDMRMNDTTGITAAEWINTAKLAEIEQVIRVYGEERYARRIARAIVAARTEAHITHTVQLANIIASAVPTVERKKNPATRTFQAIRIFINNELGDLRSVLSQVREVLRPGGRLVVISFHSLEDRIVKQFMREAAKGDDFPPEIPVTVRDIAPWFRIVNKVVKPGQEEISRNPRARSAILRVGEKLAA